MSLCVCVWWSAPCSVNINKAQPTHVRVSPCDTAGPVLEIVVLLAASLSLKQITFGLEACVRVCVSLLVYMCIPAIYLDQSAEFVVKQQH